MRSFLSFRSMRILFCGCLFSCLFVAAAFAQQQNDEIAPGMISGTSTFASPYSNGLWGKYFPRVSVQHRTEGAGYNYSFTDFRTWVPLYESYDAHALTFMDAAFLLANDRNVGMNAVVGQRFYSDDFGRTFGGYVGYDNRDTGLQTVGQVVTGFESLGRIDFRANGYFPTDTSPVSTGLSFSDPTYVGYNIQLTQLSQYQVAMKGFDAELGGAMPYVGDYVRAYLGMYNFQGEDSPQAWGWKTRFESHVTDRMRLYLTVSDDQVFNTNVVFGAAFFFPGSSARRVPRYDSFVNKMDEPIIRNEAVVVNDVNDVRQVNATNPVSGADQHVIHVDPNAVATGDGTVEHPYNALQLAQAGSQPNDIIFVHPRADDTSTNLTQSLVLQDNQRLLASTTQHQFTATQGTFDLPGYEAGAKPKLYSAGNAITLADDNEVSGFYFDDIFGTPIRGSSISGFNINNNYFDDYGATGNVPIYITNYVGTGVIRNNSFQTVRTSGAGLVEVYTSGVADLTIDGNTINRIITNGASDAIYVSGSSTSQLTANITNNYVSNLLGSGGSAIHLESGGELVANISNNEVYQGLTGGTTDYGIRVDLNGPTSMLTIDQNKIGTIATAQEVDSGIQVFANTPGETNVYITNNSVRGLLTASAFRTSIGYQASGGGTNNLVMTGNNVDQSLALGATFGYLVQSIGGSTINLNFQENVTIGDFAYSGWFSVNSSTLNVRMLNNTLNENVRLQADGPSGPINFEVFGGQAVPNPLVASDVSGQNAIGGTVVVGSTFTGTNTRVAPNSLPIPE